MTPTKYPVVSIEEALRSAADSKARQPLVMVVDDETVIADTLSAIFRQNNYRVITAYDGKSALEMAAKTPPDLVITDVVMPRMNGIDLAIALARTLPECRVLLFSGQASTMDLLSSAREMGYNFTTLSKPVHPTEMLRQVSQRLQVPVATGMAAATN